MTEVVALWKKVSKNNNVYFSGMVREDTYIPQGSWITAFAKKPEGNQPDIKIYVTPAQEEQNKNENTKVDQVDEDDDLPF